MLMKCAQLLWLNSNVLLASVCFFYFFLLLSSSLFRSALWLGSLQFCSACCSSALLLCALCSGSAWLSCYLTTLSGSSNYYYRVHSGVCAMLFSTWACRLQKQYRLPWQKLQTTAWRLSRRGRIYIRNKIRRLCKMIKHISVDLYSCQFKLYLRVTHALL